MRPLLILVLCGALAASLLAQKPKKKKPDVEPRPQALEVIPEPPEAVIAEPGRLSFQVSPLSDKGLLSQQVHDALKALARLNHGAPIVKVRAFVAGCGDLRRAVGQGERRLGAAVGNLARSLARRQFARLPFTRVFLQRNRAHSPSPG